VVICVGEEVTLVIIGLVKEIHLIYGGALPRTKSLGKYLLMRMTTVTVMIMMMAMKALPAMSM
jgi:hypothetical protein